MYELARKSRGEMKAKARALASGDPHQKVDSSSWSEAEPLDADVQTGPRVLSRRQFRNGGKIAAILGKDAAHHAGRKARKSGGSAIVDEFQNRDMKQANEERSGTKHVGGMKRGGKLLGGPNVGDMTVPKDRFAFQPTKSSVMLKRGGKIKKDTGGDIALGLASPVGLGIKKLLGKKKGGSAEKCGGGGAYEKGGKVLDGTNAGSGRIARASGGKAKGKTTVNVIVGSPHPAAPPPMGLPPKPMGMPIPVSPPAMGMPPPPGIPPQMPPPQMPPPMPPMGRKAGGKVYRNAEDMDAGAMSGLGRLEKAEIQSAHK